MRQTKIRTGQPKYVSVMMHRCSFTQPIHSRWSPPQTLLDNCVDVWHFLEIREQWCSFRPTHSVDLFASLLLDPGVLRQSKNDSQDLVCRGISPRLHELAKKIVECVLCHWPAIGLILVELRVDKGFSCIAPGASFIDHLSCVTPNTVHVISHLNRALLPFTGHEPKPGNEVDRGVSTGLDGLQPLLHRGVSTV